MSQVERESNCISFTDIYVAITILIIIGGVIWILCDVFRTYDQVDKVLSTPITKEELADFNKGLSSSLAVCVNKYSRNYLEKLSDVDAIDRPLSKPRLELFLSWCEGAELRLDQLQMIKKH